jgi:hypothetical protein
MKQLLANFWITYLLFINPPDARVQFVPSTVVKHSANAYEVIKEGQNLLKEGDLVVRLNRAPSSRFIKGFNRQDKKYSHAGIVVFEKGYPYVYHMIDGEENPDARLRKDSLQLFCDPSRNLAYGIFRYDLNDEEIGRLREQVHQYYAQGVRFDPSYSLSSDDRMYCSEFVSKTLVKATDSRIRISTTSLTPAESVFFSAYTQLPLTYTTNLSIISLDNLYVNRYCRPVQEYTY